MSIVRIQNLTRRYGNRVGVEQVNLEIGAGEVFGFLGPNGAGKTTTIRLLMGLLKPNAGRATIAGYDCWADSVRARRDVGYLPGDVRLYPWMSLERAVPMVARVRGVDIRQRAKQLAGRFELEPKLTVRKMSRGTRQKLGLVLALAHQPRLLILDEPTSGLDPLMQLELADMIREAATAGQTIFFSSHTLSEVENLCQRVAIVRRGRIIVDERLDTLRHDAPRLVELEYTDREAAVAAQLPGLLEVSEIRGATLVGRLRGPAPQLIAWAAGEPLADIRIGPPDLQALFHSLYHEGDPGS